MGTKVSFEYIIIIIMKIKFCSYHPYLFFNEDGFSITFVGFNVSHSGDLQDPARNTIIERGVMNQQLLKGLRHNKVNLSENYRTWNKNTLIQKICAVMGLDFEKQHDPDPTYVLTIDNIIKMMAIHMRFRFDFCYCNNYNSALQV